jgi:hypothetical protein
VRKLVEYRIGVIVFWSRSSEEAIHRAKGIIKDFEMMDRTLLKKDDNGLWRIEAIIHPND